MKEMLACRRLTRHCLSPDDSQVTGPDPTQAALTVAHGMVTGGEPASVVRLLLLGGLIACVIGLKVTH